MRRWVAGLFLLTAACSDEQLHLVVTLPSDLSGYALELTASVYAVANEEIDCDSLAFGDVAAAELLGSLAESGELKSGGGEIGLVPREGRKLVLVEARDGAGELAAAGCTAIGTISGRTEVEVSLEAAVRLDWEIDGNEETGWVSVEASPTEESSGSSLVLKTKASLTDAPREGVVIRVQLLDPGGQPSDEQRLATDSAGAAAYVPRPRFTGPFGVVVAPRWSAVTEPEIVSGFSAPADHLLAPPFPEEEVFWAWPMAWTEERAGFVLMTWTAGFSPTLKLSTLTIAGGLGETSLEGRSRESADLLFPLARVHDPAADRNLLVASQYVWSAASDSYTHTGRLQLVPEDGTGPSSLVLDLSANLQPRFKEELATAVPVGPCDPGQANAHPLAAPILVSAVRETQSEGGPAEGSVLLARSFLVELDGSVRGPVWGCQRQDCDRRVALESWCVRDADGAQRRILAVLEFSQLRETRFILVDVESLAVSEPLGEAALDLSSTLVYGTADAGEGADLLRGYVAGFAAAVDRLVLSAGGGRLTVRSATPLLRDIPAYIGWLGGAALTSPTGRDLTLLLGFPGTSASGAGDLLYFVADAADPAMMGVLNIGSCQPEEDRGTDDSRFSGCQALFADVEGDGQNELLLSRVGSATDWDLTALRFGSW